ncbi:MAG TPA: hypothetical protein VGL56_02710 [Fimbriimonadaceae bacterium]|jgi:hypothetical protein
MDFNRYRPYVMLITALAVVALADPGGKPSVRQSKGDLAGYWQSTLLSRKGPSFARGMEFWATVSRVMVLREDGTYTLYGFGKEQYSGKWLLQPNVRSLTLRVPPEPEAHASWAKQPRDIRLTNSGSIYLD